MSRNPKPLITVLSLALCVAAGSIAFGQAAKRPLNHKDLDAWRSIAGATLSRDGRFLAYSFMPQDGDGDLMVRDLKTGKEQKHAAGALPPPPIQNPEELNPEAPPAPRGLRIAITGDSRFVVSTTYPPKADTDKAKKERKKPEEMPKAGLVIVSLASGEATRIESVKSVQVPSKGGAWAAYLKEAKPEEKKPAETKAGEPKAEEKKPESSSSEAEERKPETGRLAGASRGGAPSGPKKDFGTDLVLRDLVSGAERTFPNVLEYSFARDGKTLIFAVSSRKEDENGVFAVAPGSDAAPAALLSGKGKYAKLTWDREQTQGAFVSDRDDAAAKAPRFKVYRWERGTANAVEVVSQETPGLPAELAVSDKGSLGFSRDGKKLYVAAGAPAKPPKDESGEGATDERVLADLWHWKDDIVQPMQKIRANQERNRTYRGVLHLAEKKYVQIADATLRTVSLSDDGTRAIGYDDRAYRRMVDYDGGYNDVYLVDTLTGSRTLVVKQLRGGGGRFGGGGLQWSPDGRNAFYFADKHWHVLDARDGSTRNVTQSLGVAFFDEEDDTPDPPDSYGQAGWTKDGRSFLVYDRYDVWQVFVDRTPAKNLTEGEGRKAKIEFRVQRIEPQEEDDDERGVDTAKPLYLRAENEETHATGFYRDAFEGSAAPQKLLWADRALRYVGRAREADVLLVSASRFDEYPDLHITDPSFKALTKVTSGGAQKDAFLWGRGELVRFRNTDGVPLQAALYKPDGFDPKKKYPLIVYIYEKLSQNVHNFVAPAPGTSINFSHYVSDGYLILTPDIVYTIGNPGQSALKCVLPAIQAVVDMGFVDEAAIGIQGHSWGGYQIAYMVTQTNRFRAAEAGAPVANMTSAYSGIRWGSGMPRQFQYEQSQSRIGPSLYEAPLKYIENSPIFHVARVQTPLLILHDDQDDAVPWYQGIELFLALRRNGKEAYMFNYNGELHGLRRRHNQKDYAIRMKQFFDHFLKGAPKPEWMEKGIPFIEREEEKERFQQAVGGAGR
jgi:dipeptidyl aminopeptidase/acylaminoacyl peptidase